VRFSLYPIVQKEPSLSLNPEVLQQGMLDFIASPQLTTSCYSSEYEVAHDASSQRTSRRFCSCLCFHSKLPLQVFSAFHDTTVTPVSHHLIRQVTPILKMASLPTSPGGTLFLASARNTAIRSIQDVRGKVVASTHSAGVFDFLLGVLFLIENGIYIHQDAKQVRRSVGHPFHVNSSDFFLWQVTGAGLRRPGGHPCSW
jgi:hypothetical protein